MISWNYLPYFAACTVLLSFAGAFLALFSDRKRRYAQPLTLTAIITLGVFITALWYSLERPPLRTMGETRLWYSFFMLIAGYITYLKWKFSWVLLFSSIMSTVFLLVTLLNPEMHDKTLMPALQSIWFVPHVTVYMFSYALLGVSFFLSLYGLMTSKHEIFNVIDTLTYAGTAFFTTGMLIGAIWANEAWGNYWSWDPKESWALITWMLYLLYIHLRLFGITITKPKILYIVLIIAFLALQMCWYGINYLPSSVPSIHIYNK